jgi:arylsulfatase A-like enzyme
MGRIAVAVSALAALVLATGVLVWLRTSDDEKRPNIVLIVTDDQRWDSLIDLPATTGLGGWMTFEESFVNDPQCCPSRATIFTGRATQHTGVETLVDGRKLDETRTVATMLDDAGYQTGFFGKYLNNYPFGRGHYVPPGWDRFVAYEGATDYYQYRLNEDGKLTEYGSAPDDYSTDVLAARGRAFIEDADSSTPIFLDISFNAPHAASGGPPVAAPRHTSICEDRSVKPRKNFNARDTAGEPAWMGSLRPVRPENMEFQIRHACQALRGVDEAVVSIVDALRRADRLDNTYMIITSDNGYSFGEHQLVGKGHLYEESIRVPLIVRGPDVKSGSTTRLTSNVDLVPTILEWAGTAAPDGFVDGRSFAASARGDETAGEPDDVLLRGCRTASARGASDEQLVCGGYLDGREMGLNWGLRTATHKYIEYPDGSAQLFDLARDPFELTNLIDEPAQAQLVAALRSRLADRRR